MEVPGFPGFIKTINDGEEVEDFSEESDVEVEYQPSKQKVKKKADFNPKFQFVSSVEEYNKNTWDDLQKYVRRNVKRTIDEKIERRRAQAKVSGSAGNIDTDSDADSKDGDVDELQISDDELRKDEIKTKEKKLSKKKKLKQEIKEDDIQKAPG
ncbi:uncharacterized protein [Choristoneura fumiferana]|uniref:uncharacterized protein n=1 Tax=Choristoneura fumiferana TaxID=7141 RepID=UPI003D15D5A6